jgi:ribosome-binding factor A
MTSTRQYKVSRLLQKELGNIFQREGKNLFAGKMITVTEVRITQDLGQARVYLSVFPAAGKELFDRTLGEHSQHIRRELGTRIRHQLRIVPELQFFLDDSLDYIENIDRLLKK